MFTSSELARPLALDLAHLHVAHFDFPAAAPAETFEESLACVHSSQHPASSTLATWPDTPTYDTLTATHDRTSCRLTVSKITETQVNGRGGRGGSTLTGLTPLHISTDLDTGAWSQPVSSTPA